MNDNYEAQVPYIKRVTEADLKHLDYAHKYEKNLKKKGYRWKQVNDHLKVLVECDADGNPTEKGLQHIKQLQKKN